MLSVSHHTSRIQRVFISFVAIGAWVALLFSPIATQAAGCTSGQLIKGSSSSVYYCGADGKRYVFPNLGIYYSWYPDFSAVVKISDTSLGVIPFGGNVTYKPGVRLVKVTTDPKVYAVDARGLLRAITSEAVATQLYGSMWNKVVNDIPDALFGNYSLGSDITAASQFAPSLVTAAATSINVDKGLIPIANNVIKRAVVIVYKNVYDALKPDIDNFQNDVFAGLGVKIDIVQLQDSLTYTPLDIRNLLIKECKLDGINGCSDLGGAVLVGDIPYAWYAEPHAAGEQAPFMYFYEDLDASFKQNNAGHNYGYDGFGAYYGYDDYGAHEGPEIYTGWIRSTFPSTDLNNHINELRAYFQKHHNFFTKQSVPAKWAVSAIHVPDTYHTHPFSIPDLGLTVYGTANSAYITPDAVDNLAPVKPALLAELSKGPEVAYLHSHGSPDIVWDLTASDFSNLAHLPLFIFTWGCANGNFIGGVEREKSSITLAFIHGKNLGLSFLSKLDSNDIDVYSGNCPDCGAFVNNQVNFFKYYNEGQYVGEAWLNVEHDFAAYWIPPQMQIPTPGSTPLTEPIESVPGQLLDLYKLSGPLQRIIMGSPFMYSPTARK